MSVQWNDRNCKQIFMFLLKNAAIKELIAHLSLKKKMAAILHATFSMAFHWIVQPIILFLLWGLFYFLKVYEVRWLCLGEAVKAVVHNYRPLMLLLEEEAALGDPASIGLMTQLKTYKFVALLHLMADVLDVTNHLSRVFQHRAISFHSIKPQVQEFLNS